MSEGASRCACGAAAASADFARELGGRERPPLHGIAQVRRVAAVGLFTENRTPSVARTSRCRTSDHPPSSVATRSCRSPRPTPERTSWGRSAAVRRRTCVRRDRARRSRRHRGTRGEALPTDSRIRGRHPRRRRTDLRLPDMNEGACFAVYLARRRGLSCAA